MSKPIWNAIFVIGCLGFTGACGDSQSSDDPTDAADATDATDADNANPDGDVADERPDLDSVSLIPAGPFWLGCDTSLQPHCQDSHTPYQQVELDAFYIDTYEVTVGEYIKCVDSGGCTGRSYGLCGAWVHYADNNSDSMHDHPMCAIKWQEAADYCAWEGKRLPTEAEWEKAARGTDGRVYPWGNTPEPSCDYIVQEDDDRVFGCGTGDTLPVGSKPLGVSVYGVHDMLGNVTEWVNDFFDRDYFDNAPEGGWVNPQGPEESPEQKYSMRGSHYKDGYGGVNVRRSQMPLSQLSFVGFRCAQSL